MTAKPQPRYHRGGIPHKLSILHQSYDWSPALFVHWRHELWNFWVLPIRFSASNVINTQFFSKIRAKILWKTSVEVLVHRSQSSQNSDNAVSLLWFYVNLIWTHCSFFTLDLARLLNSELKYLSNITLQHYSVAASLIRYFPLCLRSHIWVKQPPYTILTWIPIENTVSNQTPRLLTLSVGNKGVPTILIGK